MKKYYLSLLLLCLSLSNLAAMEFDCGDIQRSNDRMDKALCGYERKLPKIDDVTGSTQAERIVNFLCLFIPATDVQVRGQGELARKIQGFIDAGNPIAFSIAGFPGKSANAEQKVIESMFDLADYVGLLTLNYMCTQIQLIYAPGAKITILPWEVYLFAANMITQSSLGERIYFFGSMQYRSYQESLSMLCFHKFKYVRIGDYEPRIKEQVYPELCKAVEDIPAYDPQAERLPDEQFIAKELDCSLFRNAVAVKIPKINERGIDKYLKMVAFRIAHCFKIGRDLMRPMRNDYGETIYLSVRQPDDGDISKKLCVGLVYGSSGTPWHHVLGLDVAGDFCLTTRADLQQRGQAFRVCYGIIDGMRLAHVCIS